MTTSRRAAQARENSEYLHRMLSERHPRYLATLLAAERQVDYELSRVLLTVDDDPPSTQAAAEAPPEGLQTLEAADISAWVTTR